MTYKDKLKELSAERIDLNVQKYDLNKLIRSDNTIISITRPGRPEYFKSFKTGLNKNVINQILSEIDKRIIEIDVEIEEL